MKKQFFGWLLIFMLGGVVLGKHAPDQSAKPKPPLMLEGKVVWGELVTGFASSELTLEIRYTCRNVGKRPVMVLKECLSGIQGCWLRKYQSKPLVVSSVPPGTTMISVEPLTDCLFVLLPTSSTFQTRWDTRRQLDQPVPPKDLVLTIGPGETFEFGQQMTLRIAPESSRSGFMCTAGLREIREWPEVWLTVLGNAWPSDLEDSLKPQSPTFAEKLRSRWAKYGLLLSESVSCEPIRIDPSVFQPQK